MSRNSGQFRYGFSVCPEILDFPEILDAVGTLSGIFDKIKDNDKNNRQLSLKTCLEFRKNVCTVLFPAFCKKRDKNKS